MVQEIFERILFIWAVRHPASGYVQGMNDLVTPFFVVFLSQFLGGSSDLIPSEVPTLRDCLRNVLHLQSAVPNRSKISIQSTISAVSDNILVLWRQSNSDFTPPVVADKKTISDLVFLSAHYSITISKKKGQSFLERKSQVI